MQTIDISSLFSSTPMAGQGRLRFRPTSPRTTVLDVQPTPNDVALLRQVVKNCCSPGGAGVIHVGAHVGEELEQYIASGFKRILLIEANPIVIPRLIQHVDFWRSWISELCQVWGISQVPEIRILHVAAAKTSGMAAFYLSQYPVLSSLLRPSTPWLTNTAQVVRVPALSIDDAVEKVRWASKNIDLIVTDAQGADLSVLKGAPLVLQTAQMVIVEVYTRSRYLGQCEPIQVRMFLEANGFWQSRVVESDPGLARAVVAFYR